MSTKLPRCMMMVIIFHSAININGTQMRQEEMFSEHTQQLFLLECFIKLLKKLKKRAILLLENYFLLTECSEMKI